MKKFCTLLGLAVATVAGIALAAGGDNSTKPNRPGTTSPPPPPPPTWTPRTVPSPGGGPRVQPWTPAAPVRAPTPTAPATTNQAAPGARPARWNYPAWDYYPYSPYASSLYPYSVYVPYYGYVYPYAYSPWGYTPYGSYPYTSGYSYGYPYGYSPYYPRQAYSPFGPVWYSPVPSAVFIPPEQLFGPGPIMQMMGVDRGFNRPAVPARSAPVARARNADAPGLAADDAKPAPRPAGAKATETAWKLISFGDALFANRKYGDALERYRRAAQAAPQVADAWFREGFAHAATGHYDRAAKAIRRGLETKPDWANSDFRTDDLFGGDTVAKKNQLDAMLKVAEAEPANGDVALLVGLYYYFDGQPDRATPFLRRAAEIGGNDAAMKNFLSGKEEQKAKD